MVLQNKYKARASRRYQAQRGGTSTSNGRGKARGVSRSAQVIEGHGGSSSELQEDDEDDEGEEEDEDHDSDTDGEEEPSANGSGLDSSVATEKTRKGQERSKYAKRKLQSNAWRFEQEDDDEEGEDQPPEEEVDLSIVFEKARLSHLQDQSSGASKSVGRSSTEDDDVDTSLAYLHDRAADRSARRARAVGEGKSTVSGAPDPKTGDWVAPSSEMYQEAQLANRKARERTDARMKIWGALEDDLKSKTRTGGAGGRGGEYRGASDTRGLARERSVDEGQKKSTIKVLEGEDFLDSVLS